MSSMMAMGNQPSPSMMHSDSSSDMMMMMQMWFEATTKVTLWFREWKIDSDGKYAVSIIGLVVLCLFQEAISRVRTSAGRKVGASAFRPLSWSTAEENGRVDLASDSRPGYTFFLACQMLDIKRLSVLKMSLLLRALLSLLYALNLTTSYLLMLAVMTFNIGYFLAIVFGLALGHFIFSQAAQAKDTSSVLSEACCPQS